MRRLSKSEFSSLFHVVIHDVATAPVFAMLLPRHLAGATRVGGGRAGWVRELSVRVRASSVNM